MSIIEVLKSVPVAGQAFKFAELAKNVTNCTDPIGASIGATKLIVDVCTPPHIKYPVKCAILALQLGICFSTGGLSSVTSVSLGIGTARQILEGVNN